MGTIDGSVLTFEADLVTYKYDTGFGEPVVFTLTAELNEIGQDGVEEVSADHDGLRVWVEGRSIHIASPDERTAWLADMTGRITPVALQPGENLIPAQGAGIYVVAGRKIVVR